MAVKILSNFGKKGQVLGLANVPVDIEDTEYLSKYFQVAEFNPTFTAGRNAVSFNGSKFLKQKSEIQIECIDAAGQSLYIESAQSLQGDYLDVGKFSVSISVFNENVNGPGKLILVGTIADGVTVRWTANISIDKASTNFSRARFYNAPKLEINSFLYPIVSGSADYGSSQTGTSHLVTIAGDFLGNNYNRYQASTTRAGTYYTVTCNQFTLDPLLFPTASFNSQMVGQTIDLYVSKIIDPAVLGRVISLNSTQSFKVSRIINSKTLVLNGNVVDLSTNKIAWSCEGKFISNYVWIDDNVRSDFQSTSSGSILAAGTCSAVAHSPTVGTVLPANFDYSTLDYRVGIDPLWPDVFDSSMNGKQIVLYPVYLRYTPGGDIHNPGSGKAIFTIKRVLSNRFLQTTEPYTKYSTTTGYPIVDITYAGYQVLDSPTGPQPAVSVTSSLGNSYAEIVYRNIKTFSGFVARHKIFYNSLIYSPPQWQLLADDIISVPEMLVDPIASKASQYIGGFYSQIQIDQYWNQNNSASLNVLAYTEAADSVQIAPVNDFSGSDGNQYVILKTTSPGVANDSVYHPFDATEDKYLSGSGYASNLLYLRKDTLYALSFNARMDKSLDDRTAKVSFYFTSSTPEIKDEPAFTNQYGYKLGSLGSDEKKTIKMFEGQTFFFTPKNDYHGTLVIVPQHCSVILNSLSLKIYSDYAFSPDTLVQRVLFPVHVANEGFQFKSELYDNNGIIVYSDLLTTQTFDSDGESAPITPGGTSTHITQDFTVDGNVILPNIGTGGTNRILGINTANGIIAATNIANIGMVSSPSSNTYKDYIDLNMVNPTLNGRSLIVHYSGSLGIGKRIVITADGTKTVYS